MFLKKKIFLWVLVSFPNYKHSYKHRLRLRQDSNGISVRRYCNKMMKQNAMPMQITFIADALIHQHSMKKKFFYIATAGFAL